MRTSATQFQLMVEYMEKNGDLSKPSEGPQGRVINAQKWNELTDLLNADATGDTKTAEKWRKVWSDYKNNIKRKASRIHRSALTTGGGPARKLKLSEIEERVLRVLGTQAATGIMTIDEVGLEEETSTLLLSDPSSQASHPLQEMYLAHEDWNQPGPSTRLSLPADSASVLEPSVIEHIVPPEDAHNVTTDRLQRSETGPTGIGTAPRSNRASQGNIPLPLTPRARRRRLFQNQNSPVRRTRTQTQSDLARQAFLRSDSEWRAFQQEAERERIRVRELELAIQQKWIDLFQQFLDVFKNFTSNLGNR
ncbi:uncharacterized protein LOC121725755 isoform X1 [Aricia agestis]|uniref:uncharacterized protein LOC121725755 isoform X1 n=1 Tax=Aricia agestis TaxID=91739 RepID=UPI001C20191D|nr:uncharacterized protein LOC121725755 isoform X1 [Aricia agestis]